MRQWSAPLHPPSEGRSCILISTPSQPSGTTLAMTTIGKCRIQVAILVTVFVATVSSSFSDDQPVEYVDNQYQFAFQYPRDWILAEKPAPILIDAGKTRIIVRHPTEPYYVMASITGPINVLSKDKYEKSPRRDEITNGLIQRTIDQIYKKSSRKIGAERMDLIESKTIPSNIAVQFYISTLYKGRHSIFIAGMHTLPFGKPYLIALVAVSPTPVKENDTITKVFNSFHLIGQTPMK